MTRIVVSPMKTVRIGCRTQLITCYDRFELRRAMTRPYKYDLFIVIVSKKISCNSQGFSWFINIFLDPYRIPHCARSQSCHRPHNEQTLTQNRPKLMFSKQLELYNLRDNLFSTRTINKSRKSWRVVTRRRLVAQNHCSTLSVAHDANCRIPNENC